MGAYLKAEQITTCFSRLASRKSEGKTPMERTSALMYFLSVNAALKSINQTRIDLNPDKTEGANNRKRIELEFTKLVLLSHQNGELFQVCELGKVAESEKSPEKRISSNFLTVPLKKASEQTRPYNYPKRPSTPLIKMGPAATGLKWGMEIHEEWRENLPKLFSEVVCPTVFTDLAVFVFRDHNFLDIPSTYLEAFSMALKHRFTNDLAEFWIEKIKKEQVLVKHMAAPFSSNYEPMVNGRTKIKEVKTPQDVKVLKKRIQYLEGLLDKNGIIYKK